MDLNFAVELKEELLLVTASGNIAFDQVLRVTEEVLKRGAVRANICGTATASQKPGEVVFFRPLTWWEKLKS